MHPCEISVPLNTWVHLTANYDGQDVKLYINGILQAQKSTTGNVNISAAEPNTLGHQNFYAYMEETRISNTARVAYGTGEIITENIERKYHYAGWCVVEEQQAITAISNTNGATNIANAVYRQYLDGAGIDEHLTLDEYDSTGTTIIATTYYHQNHRGDTIALTDTNGDTLSRIEYTTYGQAYETKTRGTDSFWPCRNKCQTFRYQKL